MTPPQTQTWTAAEKCWRCFGAEIDSYQDGDRIRERPCPACQPDREAIVAYIRACREGGKMEKVVQVFDVLARHITHGDHIPEGVTFPTPTIQSAALTAAADREAALRAENEWYRQNYETLLGAHRNEVNRAVGAEAALTAQRQNAEKLREELVEMRKYTAKAIEHRHGYPKGDAFGDGLVQGHMNHLSALDALLGLAPAPTTGGQNIT